MQSVNKEIFINASPETVFDIVSNVVQFAKYSRYIKYIKAVRPGVYRWRVELMGVHLDWEAEVIESDRPRRFAWKPISGVYNAGAYDLEPSGEGTRVTFTMKYRLTDSLMDVFIGPVLKVAMEMVSQDLLERIKKEVERDASIRRN